MPPARPSPPAPAPPTPSSPMEETSHEHSRRGGEQHSRHRRRQRGDPSAARGGRRDRAVADPAEDRPRRPAGRGDELRVRLPDRLRADRDRGPGGPGIARVLLRPALGRPDRDLAVRLPGLRRDVPRCALRRPGIHAHGRERPRGRRHRHLRAAARPCRRAPPAHRDPHRRHPADHRLRGDGRLLPRRSVQHRGTGQLIAGAMAAGYVGFTVDLPIVVHLLICLLAGTLAGGVWGGIAGFLKARFGANEVISTIMLNWIATYLLFFALKTAAFTGANQSQPTSPSVGENAALPLLLGSGFRLHAGLFLAAGAAVALWWLMSRSTIGFHFRAVGSNPRAAQVAGISPARTAFLVLAVAGALVGLAGAVHVLGTERRLTEGVAGSIGFDAITVALLGRSGPVGIVLAGLLFAGLSTGGRFMESDQGVPLDLVQVIQVLVVL